MPYMINMQHFYVQLIIKNIFCKKRNSCNYYLNCSLIMNLLLLQREKRFEFKFEQNF